MTHRALSIASGLALLATVLAPPTIYMVLRTTSTAVGVFLVAATFALLYVGSLLLKPPLPRIGRFGLCTGLLLSAIFTHGAFSYFAHDAFDFERFWQALVLLTVELVGAYAFVRAIRLLPGEAVAFAVRSGLWILALAGLAGVLNFSPMAGEGFIKPVLFFAEPSHFALAFLPFLLYAVVLARQATKILLILASFLLGLLLQNLTLVVGVGLVCLVAIPIRWLTLVVPMSAVLMITIGTDYYAERLAVDSDITNLSTLVYLQGWERAFLNLRDSFGWGVGFEQFGIVGSRGAIMDLIVLLAGKPLNLLDGGSVASKFVAEFGLFGIVVLLAYLLRVVRKIGSLRSVSLKPSPRDPARIFFAACFVMYAIDLFVRGTGYFSPSGFLFISSVIFAFVDARATRAAQYPTDVAFLR